ncbi:MAG: lamin tail domain-containing protein [Actinobacteria bacterium]|nr:lamin tail domain-containing protein [Actinomycetota bacterium]NBY16043.1 lamin tail domain-containing protein [Actinomycetota bacterium]
MLATAALSIVLSGTLKGMLSFHQSQPLLALLKILGLAISMPTRVCLALSLTFSGIGSLAPASAAVPSIVINEVDCHGNDWIELLNKSNNSVDISNWLLTDKKLSVTNPVHIYRFPDGTLLSAGARLVVQQTGVGNLQLPFGISCAKGGIVRLGQPISPTSMILVDSILVPITPAGASFGRIPDATGAAQFTVPTKGKKNQSALPKFLAPKSVVCKAGRVCRIKLHTLNVKQFTILTKSTGATITKAGVLVIPARKLKSVSYLVNIANSYGSLTVKLRITTK